MHSLKEAGNVVTLAAAPSQAGPGVEDAALVGSEAVAHGGRDLEVPVNDGAPGQGAGSGLINWLRAVPGVRLYFEPHVTKISFGAIHLMAGYSPTGWGHEERTAYVRTLASLTLLSTGERTCGIRLILLFLNVSFIVTPPTAADLVTEADAQGVE